MIWFVVLLTAYVFALALVQPEPESLKEAKLSIRDNIKSVKATIGLGTSLIITFFFITDLTFSDVNQKALALLAFNNITELYILWPVQAVTHTFIHANWQHLLTNLSVLALLSIYERRVNAKRFLAVYIVGSLTSLLSVFFYSEPVLLCGASAGIMALAAGFVVDHENLTLKEWLCAVLLCLFLVAVFSIQAEMESERVSSFNFTIDHIGHLLGAVGGILYCRLCRRQPMTGR